MRRSQRPMFVATLALPPLTLTGSLWIYIHYQMHETKQLPAASSFATTSTVAFWLISLGWIFATHAWVLGRYSSNIVGVWTGLRSLSDSDERVVEFRRIMATTCALGLSVGVIVILVYLSQYLPLP